jgi:hypothetical protein
LLVPSAAWAQSPPAAKETIAVGDFQLSPILQVRTRGEYRRDPIDIGGRTVQLGPPPAPLGAHITDAPVFFTRARLGLGAERGAIKAQVTLQDARAWGSSPPTALIDPNRTSFGTTGAYETYLEIHTTGPQRPTFLRVGRQVVQWGDGRLLGNADLSPTARSLDGARARWSTGSFDFEGLVAFVDTPRPLGVAFSDASATTSTWGAQLYGVDAAYAFDPLLKFEAMGLARVVQQGALPIDGSMFGLARSQGETYTSALRVHGDSKGWVYSVTGMFQGGTVNLPVSGTNPTLRTRDRLAGAVAGSFAKTFDGLVWTPTVQINGGYASGDSGTGTYNQFDPILPDVSVHHGVLNVFALSNIIDLGGKIAFVPFREGKVGVEYRYVMLADSHGEWLNGYLFSVGRAQGDNERDLGHEIDLHIGWKPHPSLDLTAGYGAFLVSGVGARNILREQRRGPVQMDGSVRPPDVSHFGFLSATVTVP